jgi:tetratricopeptide (TPR) repeat protein
LIRCRSKAHFVGVVHEVIMPITTKKVSPDVYFEWGYSKQGIEQSRRRWVRDYDLLLREFHRNPKDPRTVFYLGQTKACLGQLQEACQWYELRATMLGWNEETFITYYRLAQTYEALGNWDQAQKNYLKAFSMRPNRAEPLVQLAQHYLNTGEKELCFLFSRRAVEIPYPHTDLLFIDKELYNYTRYDLLGISAWYVNEFELGKKAVLQALETAPNAPHLQRNLELYLQLASQNSSS